MKLIEQNIRGVFLIEHDVFRDERGAFSRSFCGRLLAEAGIDFSVCQGNISENLSANTLRGFHYQGFPSKEAKILTCVTGGVFDIVVDLRQDSPTYMKSVSIDLAEGQRKSLVVPAGCANAFLTSVDNTIVHYYMSDYFQPDTYKGFRYNDPSFELDWPREPSVISDRDRNFPDFVRNTE